MVNGAPAITIVACAIGVAFMGSGLITPLYAIYQKAFGFSEITLTLIYAAYVIGNVAALLFFGNVSDRVGRRPVVMVGIAAGIVSVLLFLFAPSTAWLFIARILSGGLVGLTSGTATAWLADLNHDKARATTVASVANAIGFALGPLLAGWLAQYTGAPLKTPFYAYLPLLLLTGAFVPLTRETVPRHATATTGRWKLQRVGLPRTIRTRFLAPAITAFGTYALTGYPS